MRLEVGLRLKVVGIDDGTDGIYGDIDGMDGGVKSGSDESIE